MEFAYNTTNVCGWGFESLYGDLINGCVVQQVRDEGLKIPALWVRIPPQLRYG